MSFHHTDFDASVPFSDARQNTPPKKTLFKMPAEDELAPKIKIFKPFPLNTLPPGVRQFVEHVSVATQTDPAAAAIGCLAALAALIGSRRLIQVTPNWIEPAFLWLGLVGLSGSGKTNALKKCLEWFKKRQEELEKI